MMKRPLSLFALCFSRVFPHGRALYGFAALAACAFPGGQVHAQPTSPPSATLVVESVNVVATDPTMAEVELVLSNATHDALYLTATAKSRDGVVRAAPAAPDDVVPRGRHQHITLFIRRPPGTGAAEHTDVLWVSAQAMDGSGVIRTAVDWPHDWPALAQPGAAQDPSSLLMREDDAGAFYASLDEEDFAAVDLLLQEWNTPEQRNPNGEWKLEGFRAAIDQMVLSRKWDEVRAILGRWQRAYPHSPGAALARAEAWWRYAWTLRSCACGSAERGDPATLRLFRQRLRRAQHVLSASRRDAGASPLWYEEGLAILGDGKHDKASSRAATRLFAAGIARFPQYPPLYLALADFWAPTDGAGTDWAKVEAVADLVARQTRATDGDDNYAWLYAQLSAHQQIEVDMVRDTALSWPRMRAAFGELVKRHPSADNYNLFAIFACRARDQHSYLNARMKIRGHVERDLWPSNYPVDVCDHRFMQQT